MDIHPPPTRRDLLRRATHDAHARIDALLSGGFAGLQDYGRYLRGMQRFACHGETALARDDSVASIAHGRQWLEADLAYLGLAPLPPLAGPGRDSVDGLPGWLGWHYVVAGSSLGARFLLRDARALDLDADRGAAFLSHHAQGRDWQDFLLRLERAPLSKHDLPRMCAAARDAFGAAHAAMLAARQENDA